MFGLYFQGFTMFHTIFILSGHKGNMIFLANYFLNYSLKNAKAIYVRDNLSKSILEKTFEIKPKLTYDVAFYLDKIYLKKAEYFSELILIGPISFEVTSLYSNKFKSRYDYYDYWYNLVLKNNPENVKLFYSSNEDRNECILLQKYILKKHLIKIKIVENNSLSEFVNNIRSCSKIISGRMHSLILAKTFGKQYQTFFHLKN